MYSDTQLETARRSLEQARNAIDAANSATGDVSWALTCEDTDYAAEGQTVEQVAAAAYLKATASVKTAAEALANAIAALAKAPERKEAA